MLTFTNVLPKINMSERHTESEAQDYYLASDCSETISYQIK